MRARAAFLLGLMLLHEEHDWTAEELGKLAGFSSGMTELTLRLLTDRGFIEPVAEDPRGRVWRAPRLEHSWA